MDYIEKQIEFLSKKIASRITALENSITEIRRRQREDEFIYGFGGSYNRKESAIKRREKEINELLQFKKQIQKPIIATEIAFFVLYCKECHNEILTKGRMLEGWHECPICRKMIYGKAGEKVIEIINERYLN